jgi:hypothetical protein
VAATRDAAATTANEPRRTDGPTGKGYFVDQSGSLVALTARDCTHRGRAEPSMLPHSERASTRAQAGTSGHKPDVETNAEASQQVAGTANLCRAPSVLIV